MRTVLWVSLWVMATAATASAGFGEPGPSSCTPGAKFRFVGTDLTVPEYVGDFQVMIERTGDHLMRDCREFVYVVMLPHDERTPATSGVDFKADYPAVEFQRLQRFANVTLTVYDDDIVEPSEWFLLELDHSDDEAIGANDEFDVRIRDDFGGFRLAQATQPVEAGQTAADVTVQRVGENHAATNVSLAFRQENTTGSDHAGIIQIPFPAGERNVTVNVTVRRGPDYVDQVELELFNPRPDGRTFLAEPRLGTLALLDPEGFDPDSPNVQFAASTYRVAEDSGGVVVQIVRTGNATRAFNVTYATEPGSAEPEDYADVEGTLRFLAGQVSKTFVLSIHDDDDVEGPETVWLRLLNATDANLGQPAVATVIILDDETPAPSTETQTGTPEEDTPTPAILPLLALVGTAAWVSRRVRP